MECLKCFLRREILIWGVMTLIRLACVQKNNFTKHLFSIYIKVDKFESPCNNLQRIVDWLAANFKRDEGIDLLKDKQALQRLTETAEKAKMELSSLTQANIRCMKYILLSIVVDLNCAVFFLFDFCFTLLTLVLFQSAFHHCHGRWP